MSDEHITGLIEGASLDGLSNQEIMQVREHIVDCPACRTAFAAAEVADALLKERALETFEPSPFFQTRVMAALRERSAAAEVSLWRLWRASRQLVVSMVMVVLVLVALAFFGPALTKTDSSELAARSFEPESAEQVIFDADSQSSEITNRQAFTTLYGADETEGDNGQY